MKRAARFILGAFFLSTAFLLRPAAVGALPYNATQIEVPDGAIPTTTADLGMDQGDVAWGDMNGDGRLDVVASGRDTAANAQLRVYANNGGGTLTFTASDVDGAAGGLRNSRMVLGDYDNDGDLDIAVVGRLTGGGANFRLRVYRNSGANIYTRVEVDTVDGLESGGIDFGDFDNDGDLDILVGGADSGGTPRLRVWRNLGNGTFDAAQIEVDPVNGGLSLSDGFFGDMDNDGFLDVVAIGLDTGGARQLRVFWNNGNGTFAAAQNVDGAGGGVSDGSVTVADFDSDGDLDVLINGSTGGTNQQLRVYVNNGGRAFNATQIEVDAVNGGTRQGRAVWGDTDRDGDLDILVNGLDAAGARQLRVYTNNGNGSFSAAQTEIDGAGNGLSNGGVAWGDADGDGDLDIAVSGRDSTGAPNRQVRVYLNTNAAANPTITAPTVPAGAAAFAFSDTGGSTSTFKWNPGSTSSTPAANAVMYDFQVSTTAAFTGTFTFPGQQGATPRLGSYPRPPKTFDGNTRHGVLLTSTAPWQAPAAPFGLRTDTTYFYRVATVDPTLRLSAWASGSLFTAAPPAVSTISAGSGIVGGATVTWTSAGDDGSHNNLTGNYRLQFSTSPVIAWSTTTTPAGATTVTISTANQVPGSAQTATVGGLTEGTSYFFRLFTQDDVGLFSAISNQATAFILVGTRDLTVSATQYNFGNVGMGLSTQTTTAFTITYTGNANTTFRFTASTVTAGSPWVLGTSTGPDQARLFAGFNVAQPGIGSFLSPEDVVLFTQQTCTATAYALGQGCLNLPTGTARNLWFRLDMPSTTSDASAQEQRFQITVEAGPP